MKAPTYMHTGRGGICRPTLNILIQKSQANALMRESDKCSGSSVTDCLKRVSTYISSLYETC
jgi:hypothetical protein